MSLLPLATRLRDVPVPRLVPGVVWLLGNVVICGLLLKGRGLGPRTSGLAMGMAHAQCIPLLAWLALGTLRSSLRLYTTLLLAGLVYLELVVCGLPYVGGRVPRDETVIASGLFLLVCGFVVSAPMFLFRYTGWCLGLPGPQPGPPPRRASLGRFAAYVAGTMVTVTAILSVARLLLLVAGYEEELARLGRSLPRLLPDTLVMAAVASAVAVPVVWAAFSRRRWPAWVVGILTAATVTVVLYLASTSGPRKPMPAWVVVGAFSYLGAFFLIARAAGLRFVAAQAADSKVGGDAAKIGSTDQVPGRLRPFQYSLRSWLLGIVVVAIPLAWCASVLRQQERTIHLSEQWHAVGAVARLEGGQVITLHVDGARLHAETLRDLSRLRRLRTLTARHWTDDMLDHLTGLDALESLTLCDSSVTGAGLAKLSVLSNLRTLAVTAAPGDWSLPPTAGLQNQPHPSAARSVLNDADAFGLFECQQLESVDLKDSALTVPGALTMMRQLPKLQTFKFPAGELKVPLLDVRGLFPAAHLGQLAKIARIESLRAEFSCEGLSHVGQVKQLQTLTVSGQEITDSALAHLQPLPKLARLDVSGTRVTPAGALASIPDMPGLVSLRFPQGEFRLDRDGQGCEIDLIGDLPVTVFEHLGGLTNCTKLNLKNARFPRGSIEHLQRLSALREVRLDGSSVGDDDLQHLAAVPGLVRLDVPQTNVTLEGVLDFARQRRTTTIGISSPPGELSGSTFRLQQNLTASELKRLSRLPKLERVRVELFFVQVSHPGLSPPRPPEPAPQIDPSAVGHVLRMTHVEELRVRCVDGPKPALAALSGNDRVTTIGFQGAVLQGDDLADLSTFPKLTALELSLCSLKPGTLALVGQIEALESLGLAYSRVGKDELGHIRSLARLQSLDLTASNVTDADMAHLQRLPRLSSLDLSWSRITDVGLGHLEGMVQLRQLRLTSVRGTTEPGIEKLQRALPQCEIERDRRPQKQ